MARIASLDYGNGTWGTHGEGVTKQDIKWRSLRQAFISCLGRATGSNDDSLTIHVSISANSLPTTESYQPGMYTSNPLDFACYWCTPVGNYKWPTGCRCTPVGKCNDPLAAGVHQLETTNDPQATRAQQLGSTSNPIPAAGVHQLVNIRNSLLVAGVHQSGANTSDPMAADEYLRINDAWDPHKGHQLENESIPLNFYPTSVSLEDEYTFT